MSGVQVVNRSSVDVVGPSVYRSHPEPRLKAALPPRCPASTSQRLLPPPR